MNRIMSSFLRKGVDELRQRIDKSPCDQARNTSADESCIKEKPPDNPSSKCPEYVNSWTAKQSTTTSNRTRSTGNKSDNNASSELTKHHPEPRPVRSCRPKQPSGKRCISSENGNFTRFGKPMPRSLRTEPGNSVCLGKADKLRDVSDENLSGTDGSSRKLLFRIISTKQQKQSSTRKAARRTRVTKNMTAVKSNCGISSVTSSPQQNCSESSRLANTGHFSDEQNIIIEPVKSMNASCLERTVTAATIGESDPDFVSVLTKEPSNITHREPVVAAELIQNNSGSESPVQPSSNGVETTTAGVEDEKLSGIDFSSGKPPLCNIASKSHKQNSSTRKSTRRTRATRNMKPNSGISSVASNLQKNSSESSRPANTDHISDKQNTIIESDKRINLELMVTAATLGDPDLDSASDLNIEPSNKTQRKPVVCTTTGSVAVLPNLENQNVRPSGETVVVELQDGECSMTGSNCEFTKDSNACEPVLSAKSSLCDSISEPESDPGVKVLKKYEFPVKSKHNGCETINKSNRAVQPIHNNSGPELPVRLTSSRVKTIMDFLGTTKRCNLNETSKPIENGGQNSEMFETATLEENSNDSAVSSSDKLIESSRGENEDCAGVAACQSSLSDEDRIELSDLGNLQTGASQPRIQFPKSAIGQKQRSFSSKFYKNYGWLEYSTSTDKVFCYVCRMFCSKTLRKQHETFITIGCNKWNKLGEKLKAHEESTIHRQCFEKFLMHKQTTSSGTVHEKLLTQHQDQHEQQMNYLKKLINIILCLARQGLPLRGHREEETSKNRGNFLEMCDLFAE